MLRKCRYSFFSSCIIVNPDGLRFQALKGQHRQAQDLEVSKVRKALSVSGDNGLDLLMTMVT